MDKAKGKDKHRWCWHCGKDTMRPDGNFYRCSSCGATWNDLPTPGHVPFVVSSSTIDGQTRGRPWSAPD